MDQRDPSSSPGTGAGSRHRAATLLILTSALAALVLAVAWRAGRSGSSNASSVAPDSCGGDRVGPSALVSFDVQTGALRWSQRVGEASGVVQLHGVIAAVGSDGRAVGFDATAGVIKWCRDLAAVAPASSLQPGFVAGTDVVATLTGNGHVVGLDPVTGVTRWDTAVSPPEGGSLVGGAIIYVIGVPTLPANVVPSSSLPPGPSEPPADGDTTASAPTASMPAVAPLVVAVALDSSTGRVVSDPPDPLSAKWSAAGELVSVSMYSPNRQEITVGVRDPATGSGRWSKVVAGFTSSITDNAVLVIDQTGGTGDASSLAAGPWTVQTVLTAYAAADGDPLWHVSLPGTPQQAFDLRDRIVINNGPQVLSIDASTGVVVWSVDHGSPGITDRYSEPGSYWWFAMNGDGTAITGLITAAEPYRD